MAADAFIRIAQLFLIVILGFLLKLTGYADERDARRLVKITTATFLPALIFSVIYSSEFRAEYLFVPVTGFATMIIMLFVAWLFVPLAGVRERRRRMPFVVASSAGNTGYLGYPVCLSLFGERGLAIAVMYDIFATVIYALTVAAYLIASSTGEKLTPRQIAGSVLKFIPVYAALLALLVKPVHLPVIFLEANEFLGSAAIPVILLALGLSLQPVVNFNYIRAALFSVSLKQVVSPVIAGVIASLFLTGLPWKIAVIESAMPSMTMTYILSGRYNADFRFASFLVITSTLLSSVTIPLVVSIIS